MQTILYANDLSLYSPYALHHALSLAHSFQAKLHVVHAIEPMGVFAESLLKTYVKEPELSHLRETGVNQIMSEIKGRVMESVREALEDLSETPQTLGSVKVIQGDAPQVILAEAKRLGADLLVVGSHSHGTHQETPLGRTALRLLELSEVPVYLVPMLQSR